MVSPVKFLFGLLLLIVCPATQQAQKVEPQLVGDAKSVPQRAAPKKHNSAADFDFDVRQQDAFWQLSGLAEFAAQVKDAQVRIKLQARIADALWKFDEKRARRIFEEAFQAIGNIKTDEHGIAIRALKDMSVQTQLRSELLRLIAAHDAALVEKLIAAVKEEPFNSQSNAALLGKQSERGSLYLQIAMSLAQTDPQRAAQLIRVSLESGIDAKVVGVLQVLRRKDEALADDLFIYALSLAPRDSAHPTLVVNYLAPYVFPSFGQQSENFLYEAANGGVTQTLPTVIMQFLNFAFGTIMQQTATAPTTDSTRSTINYSTAQLLLPYFNLYMPEQAGSIGSALTLFSAAIPPDQVERLDTFTRPNTVEDLLDKAEKTTQREIKDIIFAQAAMKIARAGDTARALATVDRISNEQMRADFGSLLRFQAITAALSKADVETAYLYAKDLANLPLRAYAMTEIAQALEKKKEKIRALELLEEVQRIIGKAENNMDKANAALIITSAMARLDAPRGFELMTAAVKTINDSAVDVRYQTSPAKSQAAPSITAMMNAGLGVGALDFDKSFSPLAHADYPQALFLAKTLSNKEAAALAQLAVCRAVLTEMRKKSPPPAAGDAQGSAKPKAASEKAMPAPAKAKEN